jgi:EAL domain-containing protein (putative c-di-GMP-specific phosphodiesterase class I)
VVRVISLSNVTFTELDHIGLGRNLQTSRVFDQQIRQEMFRVTPTSSRHLAPIFPPQVASGPPIRVVVVDDHEMILQSVERLLAADPQITIVGTALTAADGMEMVWQTTPDVLVLDYHLPDMDAPEVIRHLKASHPDVKIVTFSGADRPGSLYESMEAGSSAWVRKTRAIQELRDAIVCVAAGLAYVNDEIEAQPRLDQLTIHYQPVVTLDEGLIVGFEALVRWQHPQQGLLYPAAFLPHAERTGFVEDIDRWVREQAIAQLAIWQQRFPSSPSLWMGVNVSSSSLAKRDLVATTDKFIADYGVQPRDVIIEIKESALVNSAEDTIELLSRLHAIGVRLALEDYGSSFSAMSHVHKHAFDCLKIERSFTTDLPRALGSAWLISGIAEVTKSMHSMCIAEGLQNMEQVDALRESGVNLGQGFLFSPPVSVEECHELLRNRTLAPTPAVVAREIDTLNLAKQ